MKLEIESIPEYNWHQSLAYLLPKPVWDDLRREVYRKAHYICTICKATNVEVHCHEIWGYSDKKHIQFLKGFQCICKDCHNIRHWGRTVALVQQGKLPSDYLDKLTEHFCKVNNCTLEEFESHKVERGALWMVRNKKRYQINWGKLHPDLVLKVWLKGKGRK